jgi:WD repeat-containing protein 19
MSDEPLRLVFVADSRHHGKGNVLFSWHPKGLFLAVSGASKVVRVFDRHGRLIDDFLLPAASPCLALEWDARGEILAALQSGSSRVVLWFLEGKSIEHVDLNVRDPTLMTWSRAGQQLAVGTMRGEMLIYDRASKQCWYAAAKHKKRITCGAWSSANHIAFGSDDRQISIALADGTTLGQVRVKSKPTRVQFGGSDALEEKVVSVSMDRKTVLLYNLDNPENALELAFQPRYGQIVSFRWFRNGCFMVAFSLGYLVVISTNIEEIGREQFCARFHKETLRDMAYSAVRHEAATCSEHCIKLVNIADWKERCVYDVEKSAGPLEKLEWSPDGRCLCASSKTGTLLVFEVRDSAEPTSARHRSELPVMPELSPVALALCALGVLAVLILVASTLIDASPSDLVGAFVEPCQW